MTLVPWWCLFLHVMGFHCHILRHSRSWNGYNFHTYPHPAKKPVIPRDIMVDVINNLGLKLLAIHNEYNENNIAISPYGALSVLVALGEGLEGDAVYEIQKATHIPTDISVIRVGLRDVHRHLKSYFIPKEGFLAGLTLNHENVTLRPGYEEILQFYGYDTATFNNALYPQSDETDSPQTTAKLETTTEMGRTDEMDMTTSNTETTSYPETTTSKLPPTETTTIIPETTVTTMPVQETTTVTLPQTTDIKTTEATVQTTITVSTTTNKLVPESTTEMMTTTKPSTIEDSTTANSITTLLLSTEEIRSEEVQTQSISTKRDVSTTEMTSTVEALTSSDVQTSTTQLSTVEALEAGTTTIQSTELTTTLPTTLLITPEASIETTDSSITMSILTTIAESTVRSRDTFLGDSGTLYTSESNSTTTDTTSDTDGTTSLTTVTTDTTLSTTLSESSSEKNNKDNEIEGTDSSADETGFGGISKRKIRSRPSQTNVVNLNMKGALLDRKTDFGYRRTSRSVFDYFIARYYDDQLNFNTNRGSYIPEEQPSFLIYGKYREYNINFMKYNTVLPFHYEPHLNALALSFPLDSTKYYLLLLLPVDETGIDKLICDLRLNGSIKYIIANLRYTHVAATIPSFTLRGYVTLTPSFQKLGIRKVFEPRQADFAPMTNQSGIYVTNIEQAITVTIRNYVDPDIVQDHRYLRRHDPVHFKADHPFLYFVIDSEIHVTLMAGKIVNPLNSRIR